MKRDDALLWIVALLLLAAVAVTILFAPRRSRHGYGESGGQDRGMYVFIT